MSVFIPNPAVTVVLPVYKNAGMLAELYRRLCQALEQAGIQFEIVFIDDACPQESLTVLKQIAAKDVRVAVLVMECNVGQQSAVLAGLCVAAGRAVVIMDADLQDPPEAVPVLLEKLNEGYDVVFAGRRGNYEASIRLLTSRLYKGILRLLIHVPRDAGMFLIMRKETVKRVLMMKVTHPHLVAMIGVLGISSAAIPVERKKRPAGVSAFTSRMRLRMGLRAVFWAIGWRLGLRPAIEEKPDFPIKERIGLKFYQ
jgi:polyisoprenyl-phosphate glycosyltransferase